MNNVFPSRRARSEQRAPLSVLETVFLIIFVAWLFDCLAPYPTEAFCAEDPFAANVRPTEPLSPEDERRAFRLPPGFVVDLVASEPEIYKPINLAFDARGRLWVTSSTEYPYVAPPDREARDRITILEDRDGDGRAENATTFAEGLNVPIGILPYRDGAIVYSVPFIYFLRDIDGDDRADEQRVLYGPMGYKDDTHGMNNAFRRAFDGWVYACHGFRNTTRIHGADGHEIEMNSGNTYRFRVDGSRVEHFTWGQVNPFGMACDDYGFLYTADCHSSPVYQLIRDGYYPSFGKPHDGLGFVPPIMQHHHGSTAICGLVYYSADQFPPEYRGNVFIGNVMTSRVNRDTLVWNGSTVKDNQISSAPRTLGFDRWTCSWARTERSTSPTSTIASLATTKCR